MSVFESFTQNLNRQSLKATTISYMGTPLYSQDAYAL